MSDNAAKREIRKARLAKLSERAYDTVKALDFDDLILMSDTFDYRTSRAHRAMIRETYDDSAYTFEALASYL